MKALFIFLFLLASVLSAQVPTPSSKYHFNEGGGSIAYDAIRSNNGIIGAGVTLGSAGKENTCFTLSGANNSNVVLPDVSTFQFGTGDFSMEFYVKPVQFNLQTKNAIIGGENGCATLYVTNAGILGFGKVNYNDASSSYLTVPIDGNFHCIQASYKHSTHALILGVDGQYVTISYTVDFTAGAASNGIGYRSPNIDKWIGAIDEPTFWNEALTQAQLLDSYTGPEEDVIQAPEVKTFSKKYDSGQRIYFYDRKYQGGAKVKTFDINSYAETFYGKVLYVDALNAANGGLGNDANDGLTPETPVQTLSRAQALLNNTFSFIALSDTVYSGALNISSITKTSGDSLIVTTWDKYGHGYATIAGETVVTGFTQNGSLWTKTISSGMPRLFNCIFPSNPYWFMESHLNGIRINGTYYGVSRYPNGEHQYLSFESGTASPKTMTDNQGVATNGYWTGGTIACQFNGAEWVLGKAHIDGYSSGGVFSVSSVNEEETRYDLSSSNVAGVKYYILNHPNAADQSGEWWQDHSTNTLGINYPGNLNAQVVTVPLQDSCLNISGSSYIKIKKIKFRGANKIQCRVVNSTGIDIEGCVFDHSPAASIAFVSCTNYKARNNNLYDPSDNGIYSYKNHGTTIINNYVHNAGVLGLYGGDANGIHMQGITTQYDEGDILIDKNFVDGSGYNGIGIGTSTDNTASRNLSILVRDNYQANAMQISSDGGGFYAFGYIWNNSKIIRNNTIVSTYKNYAFVKSGTCIRDGALYIDNPNRGWLVENNTIYDYSEGYFPNIGTNRITLRNNVAAKSRGDCSNLDYAFHVRSSSMGSSDSTRYVRNKMVSGPLSENYNLWLSNSDGFTAYNNFIDSNDYYNPFDGVDYVWMTTTSTYTSTYRNLTWVRANTPWEDNSTLNKTNWTYSNVSGLISEDDFTSLFVNHSGSAHVFTLGSNEFYDLDGNIVTGNYSLPAYTSKVLFYKSGNYTGPKIYRK
jgi:hypothetical protein